MIDAERWSEEEIKIFSDFGYKCVRCRRPASVIHEIVPRSLMPDKWMEEENRVPLCIGCHQWAHSQGTSVSSVILKSLRRTRLHEYRKE